MIDIIFENRGLKFTNLSASDFNDYNLSYDKEAGTVTFKGYVFNVNEPYLVYEYLKEKERFTDPKTRVLVEIRMAPTGQFFARRQYFPSAAKYRFARIMEKGLIGYDQYNFINRMTGEQGHDFWDYIGHDLGPRVR